MLDPRFDKTWRLNLGLDFRGALMINNIETPQAYFYPLGFEGFGLNAYK